jgi:hypothetical protein
MKSAIGAQRVEEGKATGRRRSVASILALTKKREEQTRPEPAETAGSNDDKGILDLALSVRSG